MGGKTTTSTNKVEIPKEVLARYNAVNAQAQQVAQNPFQQYGTQASDFVAQFNPQQLQGVDTINSVANMGPAYESVDRYMNPFIKNVADTTRAQMQQANEQAQSGALGTAIQSGAFGGDRAGVAAANLANQQNLAMGSTMANIFSQGYDQAVNTSMADANRMLGVAGAQLGAGTQMQQTEQAGKDALINQFQQQMGYPFQVAQFLANIAMGTGALSGSTTTSTQQGSFFSDRRLKHDIKEIGKSHNGLPIYTFKYKGDPESNTHVGFMADEVEQKNPEAVGVDPSGYKTVDYDKATHSMGGGVAPRHSGEGFAEGGVAGPYGSKVGQSVGLGSYVPQAYLPVSDLMMADPNVSAQKTADAAQVLEMAANTGKNLSQLDETFGKDGKFYKMFSERASGGLVQPQKHEDYVSKTLSAQEAGKEKPELKTAQPQQHQPSGLSQVASALGSIASIASLSDRRAKHDIKEIGKTHNGLPIYTFKYKGDNKEQTHIGFMADEVEKKHPEAVGESNGLKTVDYGQAHKFASGGVAGQRLGYADGGSPLVADREKLEFIRSQLGSNNGMTTEGFKPTPLNRADIPAAQTLGSLPDARVENASPVAVAPPASAPQPQDGVSPAPLGRPSLSSLRPSNTTPPVASGGLSPEGAEDESARAYREAAQNRFNANQFTGLMPATPPTVSAPTADQIRPPARPEGLGAAAPVVAPQGSTPPMPRPAGLGAAAQTEPSDSMNDPSGFFRTKILGQESGHRQFDAEGRPLESPKGAIGIAQVMEGTGPEAAKLAGLPWDRERWLNDAEYNAQIGEAYFLDQHRKFGSLDKAAAAYNAGPGALNRAMEKAERLGGSYLDYLPEETRNYVASTTGLSGSARPEGGVKPYDERNFLGKIMRNEDGTMNRDAMLSVIAGIGDMLASPSPFLLPSIGAGLSGAANTYMAREGQVADIQNKRLDAMKKVSDETIRYNARYKTNYTPEEYRALALDMETPPPDPSRIVNQTTYNGVPLDPFGGNLNDLMPDGRGGFIRAGDNLQYNERLLANQEAMLAAGAIDQATVANTAAQIAEIKARNGVTPVLDENGNQKLDEAGSPMYTTDSTVTEMEQAAVAFETGNQLKSTVGERIAANNAASTAVDNMAENFIASADRQGILADVRSLISGISQETGIGTGNFRALYNEIEKAQASFADQHSGTNNTDFARQLSLNGLPAVTKEAASNAYVLATMQAFYEREAAILEAISNAPGPQDAYNANSVISKEFDMAGTTDKYYRENLKRMGVPDPSAAPAPAPAVTPPQRAVDFLLGDPSPEAIREFNEIFGQGAAERVMGG